MKLFLLAQMASSVRFPQVHVMSFFQFVPLSFISVELYSFFEYSCVFIPGALFRVWIVLFSSALYQLLLFLRVQMVLSPLVELMLMMWFCT